MTDIQPIQPPQIPPSFFQQMETYGKEMFLVSGINEELMGSAVDDKAGILSMLRQGAGLVTLQPLFDRFDNSCILLGELMMKIIRANYTPGKIRNILEGEQPAPLFYNKAFGKYHCMVQLGFNTESQKQMEFAQLMQLAQMGLPIPPQALIEAATLQNKTRLIAMIEQQQQQQMQMQQAQMQTEMQAQQAQAQLYQARAMADQGLGMERMSRIQENQALATERRSQAVKDDFQALLNYVKAIKEIEGIDLAQLEKIFALKRMISDVRTPETEPMQRPGLQELFQ